MTPNALSPMNNNRASSKYTTFRCTHTQDTYNTYTTYTYTRYTRHKSSTTVTYNNQLPTTDQATEISMAIITRFTLVAVFGVALIALATTSVVSADAASMGEEDHAMKTEQAADAGGGYMKAPGDKIQQPTDPGADIEATDAAAHGASPDEEEGKEEEEPDAAAHAHEEDAPAAEEKPEEEEGETEEGGDIVTEDKEEGADELVPLVETLSADPEFATLVAAVKVAVDAEGKKLPDDLAAEGPFTVGSHPLLA